MLLDSTTTLNLTSSLYNLHRWYEPGAGRYTRPDPITSQNTVGGISATSIYVYVGAQPLTSSDPLGLFQVFGSRPFRGKVESAMARLDQDLAKPEAECCRQYFSDLGVDLDEWIQQGGKPFIRDADVKTARDMARQSQCGGAQPRPPFLWVFVRPDCFRKPDPCGMASLLLHEFGHLARKDTKENEPSDFFEACSFGCIRPGDFR